MKNFNNKIFLAAIPVIALLVFLSFGCSSESPNFIGNASYLNSPDTGKVSKYSFMTHQNGERISWRVTLRDGEIVSAYKNGDRLSDNEINDYKDMIMDRIDSWDDDNLYTGNYKFNFDYDFSWPDSDFYFNSEAFRGQMKKLKEEMKKMKNLKVNVHFNNEEFRKSMKELRKSMKSLKDNDFFDSDEFEKSMEEFSENMKNHPINIDINFDELNKSMANLKINMKDLKIDLHGLKAKMKKLKEFLKDMRSELVKDGYLDNEEEDFDMIFTKDKLVVNGERLPDKLLEKYKEIYKEHFGHEINDKFRICN